MVILRLGEGEEIYTSAFCTRSTVIYFSEKMGADRANSILVLSPSVISKATRVLKQATFLSHGRKPAVNISHANTVVSHTFSTSEETLNNINVVV